jgi:hypothetical protein
MLGLAGLWGPVSVGFQGPIVLQSAEQEQHLQDPTFDLVPPEDALEIPSYASQPGQVAGETSPSRIYSPRLPVPLSSDRFFLPDTQLLLFESPPGEADGRLTFGLDTPMSPKLEGCIVKNTFVAPLE